MLISGRRVFEQSVATLTLWLVLDVGGISKAVGRHPLQAAVVVEDVTAPPRTGGGIFRFAP